jgi:hypothetical protein
LKAARRRRVVLEHIRLIDGFEIFVLELEPMDRYMTGVSMGRLRNG